MRRIVIIVSTLLLAACSSGGSDDAMAVEDADAEAIEVVSSDWGDCFALVGVSVEGVSTEATPDALRVPADDAGKSVLVTLTTGEQFIVVVGGQLKGARVANDAAAATLNRAAAAGGEFC